MLRFHAPFEMPMPGLMYHLDIFEKRFVDRYLAANGELPPGMEKLRCTEAVSVPRKLTAEFPEFNLTLVGMLDAVFRRRDDTLTVVDYKTATCRGEDDPFLPAYKVQLLGYAELLEQAELGPVTGAALVYFENRSKEYRDSPLDLATDDGFSLPFSITTVPVELDRKALKPLMKRFREIADLNLPPKGREGCKDCARLQYLLDDESNRRSVEDHQRNRDGLARVTSRRLQADRELALRGWDGSDDSLSVPPDLHLVDSIPGSTDL
jgi:hypothetical protein